MSDPWEEYRKVVFDLKFADVLQERERQIAEDRGEPYRPRHFGGTDPTVIGPFEIPFEARLRGTYVVGKTGTGKSQFLTQMITQDIAAGRGVLVLDPHGGLVDSVLAHSPTSDLHVLELTDIAYPFGLNIYECDDPADPLVVARTVSPVMQLFERLWGAESSVVSWGPRMAQYLRNCALLLVDNPGYTMAEIPLLLTQKAPRQRLVANCTNPSVRAFWEAFEGLRRDVQLDRVDSTFNKVDDFVSSPLVRNIVGQSQSTIDVDSLMADSGILLVKLDPQLTDLTAVVGALLISRVLSSALKRGEDAPEFCLYADEYQRFATPDFATLLSEARKYNVATTIAHQFRGQLDERNRGASLQSGSVIVFEVTPDDARDLAGLFDATPPEPKVTGQRAILRPAASAIETLEQRGHANPEVAEFFAREIRPMLEVRRDRGVEQSDVDLMVSRIDAYLLAMMDDEIDLPEAARFLLEAHRPYVKVDNVSLSRELAEDALCDYIVGLHRGQNLLEDLIEPLAASQHRINELEVEHEIKWINVREQNDKEILFKDGVMTEQTKEVDWIGPRTGHIFYKTRTVTWEEHKAQYDRSREILREKLEPEVGYAWAQSALPKIEAFFTPLVTLGLALSREPVYRETGQYEPIYETERPYADVTNQIANALSTQGRFHAWAKIMGEQIVDRVPYEGGAWLDPAQREEIREASRERYGRPRGEVEREILDRQSALVTFEHREAPTEPSVQPTFPPRKGPPPQVS